MFFFSLLFPGIFVMCNLYFVRFKRESSEAEPGFRCYCEFEFNLRFEVRPWIFKGWVPRGIGSTVGFDAAFPFHGRTFW